MIKYNQTKVSQFVKFKQICKSEYLILNICLGIYYALYKLILTNLKYLKQNLHLKNPIPQTDTRKVL